MLQNLDHYVNADVGREATTGVVHIRERNVLHRLIVPLTFEGADIDLTDVDPLVFVYEIPSGSQSTYYVTAADGCATVPLGLTVVTSPGEVKCQIEGYKNSAKVFSTPIIRLEVDADLYDEDAQAELVDEPTMFEELAAAIALKQDALTFDDEPTESSVNPVKSGGIKDYVDNALADIDLSEYTKTEGLAAVALSGDYDDLIDKPTIPTVPEIVLSTNYNGDGNMNTDEKIISSKAVKAFVEGKGYITSSALSGYVQSSSLATVATTGDYDDLIDKPTIPTVPELSKSSTITQDISSDTKTVTPKAMKTWVDAQSFAASSDIPTVPTKVSDLTNDSGFITSSALSGYAQTADLATVATTGDYDDLTDKPTIPTKTSDLTNNSGFLTEHQSLAGYAQTADLAAVATSGSYADLSNKPTIPTVPDLSKSSTIAQDLSSDTKTVTPKAMKTWVDTQTDEVMQVANGKCACYVFDEKEDLDDWLEVAANVAKLHTGDVFLIRDTDVPDYWWDGSTSPGTTQVLETTKVDLDDYVQSTDLATVATSGSYVDLSNKPSLATVATSGSYNDLSDKPSLATVATSGSYADLSNKPSLATVATSGSYNDLTDRPAIPTKTSDLTNDSGFLTSSDLSGIQETLTFDDAPTSGSANPVKSGGVYTALAGKQDTLAFDSAPTENSNNLVKSGKLYNTFQNYATKTYVDEAVAGIDELDLTDYVQASSLAAVATTGDYEDLTNTPSIPTKTSDLTNDAGFLTEHQSLSGYAQSSSLAAVATSGSYADLSNKPTIPTVPDLITYSNYSANMTEDGKTITPKAVKAFVEGKEYQTATLVSNRIAQEAIVPSDLVDFSDVYSDEQVSVAIDNKPITPKAVNLLVDNSYNVCLHQSDLVTTSNYSSNMTSNAKVITPAAMKAWVDAQNFAASSAIPTVPTNVSSFTNDAGYLTEHQSLSGYVQSSSLATVATSGSYADLSNKPTIPTVPDLSKSSTVTQDISSDTKTVTPKAMKTWVEGKNYLTSHQSLSDYATKTYADGKDTRFVVTGDVNTQTFAISNLSCSLADAQAAIAAGKTPELHLTGTSVYGQGVLWGNIVDSNSAYINFTLLAVLDVMQTGTLTPVLLRAAWLSTGMTVDAYMLTSTKIN